jgi:ferritin
VSPDGVGAAASKLDSADHGCSVTGMQMSAELETAFSEQITLELASSIAYIQLSAGLAAEDLPGMASWMRIQADEERMHADKFIDHVLDRGNAVQIGAIEAPSAPPADVIGAFEAALQHEQRVSEAIRELYRLASSAGDIDSLPLLSWFLTEQIEEESTVSEILGRLRRIGDDGSALLFLDSELGARTLDQT